MQYQAKFNMILRLNHSFHLDCVQARKWPEFTDLKPFNYPYFHLQMKENWVQYACMLLIGRVSNCRWQEMWALCVCVLQKEHCFPTWELSDSQNLHGSYSYIDYSLLHNPHFQIGRASCRERV